MKTYEVTFPLFAVERVSGLLGVSEHLRPPRGIFADVPDEINDALLYERVEPAERVSYWAYDIVACIPMALARPLPVAGEA